MVNHNRAVTAFKQIRLSPLQTQMRENKVYLYKGSMEQREQKRI